MGRAQYTSIQHIYNNDYISLFSGDVQRVVKEFEAECLYKEVIWARLFISANGETIAHYDCYHGFATTI